MRPSSPAVCRTETDEIVQHAALPQGDATLRPLSHENCAPKTQARANVSAPSPTENRPDEKRTAPLAPSPHFTGYRIGYKKSSAGHISREQRCAPARALHGQNMRLGGAALVAALGDLLDHAWRRMRPRSSGLRLVTRPWSVTTSLSSQLAPRIGFRSRLDRLIGRDVAAIDDAGLDQQPRAVADGKNR